MNYSFKISCILLCCFLNFNCITAQKKYSKEKLTYEKRIGIINNHNTIKVTKNPRIVKRIIKMSKKRSLSKILNLADFYFPLFEAKLKEYQLPQELKYLPIVESNLQTTARSHAGAQGLWQFMYKTGSQYGLKRNKMINTFNDPIASTDAACRYLKYLYGQLHDWELALAAYNCGIGRVKKILKRTGKKTFWEIIEHLPKETQNYVPAFLAVNYLMYFKTRPYLYYKKAPITYNKITIVVADKALQISKLGLKTKKEQNIFRFINPHLISTQIPKGMYYYAMK